jgi:diketogulonate reductase-like aldo/keto reductase
MDDDITIGDGTIPLLGLGTYLCTDEDASASVKHALEVGYRCTRL